MINASQLLTDLTRQLKRLEEDLRQRIVELPEIKASLMAEWQAARDAARTAETFESWADQVITQAGVHWLLSCVFIRFIEDNCLVERPWLAGTPESGRLALARDRHEAYFQLHPTESDREFLVAAFREAGALPGLHTFFDEAHNPVFRLAISGSAAMALRQFWQQVNPNTGTLVHDFTDPDWNTRFLGDLYQDLSEATRKRYALLQTPEFVEEFILDRTLIPAIREFGFREVRMIDPTCGSGHFLLGGFYRLVEEWTRNEPARNRRDIAQKALDAVAGVDLNPFAVAIARFRLLVAALKVSEWHGGLDRGAPNFKLNVAIGDSLLHGKRFGLTVTEGMFEGSEHYAGTGLAHAYASEDLTDVNFILGRQYHAVVGNPPYIVVKDAALNSVYRQRYASCHMKYSLGAPFTERFFELALTGNGRPAGFVGLITTNSFMKREYGSKLIEEVLPRLDLTHVVDSSGAWIPGHNRDGTATVILFGRHRPPVDSTVRTVVGIRNDPGIPENPAEGPVWSAIVTQIDRPTSVSEFITVGDVRRQSLSKHPWSIAGGSTTALKESIESAAQSTLRKIGADMGVFGMTNADEVMLAPSSAFARKNVDIALRRPLVVGDLVRDWTVATTDEVLFPYSDNKITSLLQNSSFARWLWPCRTSLGNRATFSKKTYFEEGRHWWGWHQVALRRVTSPLTITFGEIATHNHFVLDRGGKVFKQTAPVIKLPMGASEDEHLGLLGLLNSSVACFWLKQMCFPKDGQGQMWEERFAFNATNIAEFPVPYARPTELARHIDNLAHEWTSSLPAAVLETVQGGRISLPSRVDLDRARERAASLMGKLIALQDELDWQCYGLYALIPAEDLSQFRFSGEPPAISLGERAFEIALARRVDRGELSTNWFERHSSKPTTEIPAHWPEEYREVVDRRVRFIDSNANIRLLEQPLFKRRWCTPSWGNLERSALRNWLLDWLEAPHLWPASDEHPPQLTTVNRLADAVRADVAFMHVAELYAGHASFDVGQVVAELIADESVPFLPVLRYTDTGLRKYIQWENTWALQRREDAGENTGKIPVPPKYKKEDFKKSTFWDLRGGLDVPKERWVSFPSCERGADTSLPIAWAGWTHLQLATALAAYYLDMKDNEGWARERLQPLLAGLLDLVPWLKQWHNDAHPVYGECMGDYYGAFVQDQTRELGFTLNDLPTWKPADQSTRGVRRRGA